MLKVDRQYQDSSIDTDSKEWNDDYLYSIDQSTISSSWSIISSNKYLYQSMNNFHHNSTYNDLDTTTNTNDNFEFIPSSDDTTKLRDTTAYSYSPDTASNQKTKARLFPYMSHENMMIRKGNGSKGVNTLPYTVSYDPVLPSLNPTQKSLVANIDNSTSTRHMDDDHDISQIEDSLLVVMIDKLSVERYEALFESVHDMDCVDGVTVRHIWAKSNLPKQILHQIWSDCDPFNNGYLDRNAFIKGMGHIDTLLAKQNKL